MTTTPHRATWTPLTASTASSGKTVLLPPGSAVSDFTRSKAGVTFDAGAGDDLVLGSGYADRLKGGVGNDALFGNGGADTIQGGTGLDTVTGGSGSDTFVFGRGDLIPSRSLFNGYLGLVDSVLDFQGAGTSGSGDQDVLRLEGFGAGTTLAFSGYGLTRSLQYYEVRDPTTPGADGFILVGMAGGSTKQLTGGDYVIVPPVVPDRPVDAVDDAYAATEDAVLTVAAAQGVLANDAAPDGGRAVVVPQGAASVTLTTQQGGTVVLAADGSFTYAPRADFAGTDSFAYTTRDADGDVDTATVTLTMAGVNDAPLFGADSFVFALAENNAAGALVGTSLASDADGDPITYAIAQNTDASTANDVPFAVDAAGRITATRPLDHEVQASYQLALQATDPSGLSDTVSVTVDVQDVVERTPLDVVTGGSGTASVRLGQGDGTFAGGSEVPVDDGTEGVALGDLDGDGVLDIVTANRFASTVSVRFGDGEGGFGGGSEFAAGNDVTAVALGDLDGDGALDIVVANGNEGTVSLLRQNDQGGFVREAVVVRGAVYGLSLGDVDGNGILDVAAAGYGRDVVSLFLQDGQGGFRQQDVSVGLFPTDVALGDVNGDGTVDLVSSNAGSRNNSVSVLLQDDQGTFARTDVAVGARPEDVALGDLEGDGDLDIVTANSDGGSVTVLRQDAQGGFVRTDVAVGGYPLSAMLGDLDGDGDLDIVVANNGDGETDFGHVDVLLQDDQGGFARQDTAVDFYPTGIALGDLDGEGAVMPSGLPDLGPLVPVSGDLAFV